MINTIIIVTFYFLIKQQKLLKCVPTTAHDDYIFTSRFHDKHK